MKKRSSRKSSAEAMSLIDKPLPQAFSENIWNPSKHNLGKPDEFEFPEQYLSSGCQSDELLRETRAKINSLGKADELEFYKSMYDIFSVVTNCIIHDKEDDESIERSCEYIFRYAYQINPNAIFSEDFKLAISLPIWSYDSNFITLYNGYISSRIRRLLEEGNWKIDKPPFSNKEGTPEDKITNVIEAYKVIDSQTASNYLSLEVKPTVMKFDLNIIPRALISCGGISSLMNIIRHNDKLQDMIISICIQDSYHNMKCLNVIERMFIEFPHITDGKKSFHFAYLLVKEIERTIETLNTLDDKYIEMIDKDLKDVQKTESKNGKTNNIGSIKMQNTVEFICCKILHNRGDGLFLHYPENLRTFKIEGKDEESFSGIHFNAENFNQLFIMLALAIAPQLMSLITNVYCPITKVITLKNFCSFDFRNIIYTPKNINRKKFCCSAFNSYIDASTKETLVEAIKKMDKDHEKYFWQVLEHNIECLSKENIDKLKIAHDDGGMMMKKSVEPSSTTQHPPIYIERIKQ